MRAFFFFGRDFYRSYSSASKKTKKLFSPKTKKMVPIQRSQSNFVGYFVYGNNGKKNYASFFYGNSEDYLMYPFIVQPAAQDNERNSIEDIPIVVVNYRQPSTFTKSDFWQLAPVYVVNMKFVDSVKFCYHGGMKNVGGFFI